MGVKFVTTIKGKKVVVPSGSKGFKQISGALGGGTISVNEQGVPTPQTSTRVISDPKTGKAITRIRVIGKDVYIDNLVTGKSQQFKSDKLLTASEVSLADYGIKSYAEQIAERPKVITKQTKPFEPGKTFLMDKEPIIPRSPDVIVSKAKNEDTSYEKSIKNTIQREKNLDIWLDVLRIRKDETKPDWSLGEIGKSIGRAGFGIISAPSVIGGRVKLAAQAITKKQGRTELYQTIGEVPGAIKESYNPKTPEGLINIGLTAFAVKGVAKGSTLKSVTKEPARTVDANIAQSFDRIVSRQRSDVLKGGEKSGLSREIMTESVIDIPKEGPASFKAFDLKPKETYSGVSFPSGKQYTTQTKKFAFKDYIIKTEREPTGITTQKVFQLKKVKGEPYKSEKLISSKTYKTDPTIKFTEPKELISSKSDLKASEYTIETQSKLITSRAVSTSKKSKFDVKGIGAILEKQTFQAGTKEGGQAVKAFVSKDFDRVSLEYPKTKYEFVDYPTKPKPIRINKDISGASKERPAIDYSAQVGRSTSKYRIKYEARDIIPKRKPIKERNIQDFINENDLFGMNKRKAQSIISKYESELAAKRSNTKGLKDYNENEIKSILSKLEDSKTKSYKKSYNFKTEKKQKNIYKDKIRQKSLLVEKTEQVRKVERSPLLRQQAQYDFQLYETAPSKSYSDMIKPISLSKSSNQSMNKISANVSMQSNRLLNNQKSKPYQEMILSNRLNEINIQKNIPRSIQQPKIINIPKIKLEMKQVPKSRIKQRQKIRQIQKQRTVQVQKLKYNKPTLTRQTVIYPSNKEITRVPIKPYFMFTPKRKKKLKKKKKLYEIDIMSKYNPSLASIDFDKVTRIPKELTGLEIRPLIK